jgi:3',5'-cyclic AMP phosphodiesterase CpdA
MLIAACFVPLAMAAGTSTRGANPLLSFGVVADVQYRDANPLGTRFYRDSLGKLAEAVARLNALGPRFTIQLGDLIDGTFSSYDDVLPLYDALKTPHYHVLGNHDFAVDPADKGRVLHRLGLDALGSGKGYYDFGVRGWRFIVLNGSDLSVVAYPPGSAPRLASERYLAGLAEQGVKNALEWNGGIGTAQREWLGRMLARAQRANERVIVFCHFPVLPASQSGLWNDREVLAILRAHRSVVAYFSGHAHEGGYVRDGGIHYLTFQGMVEGPQPAYALVEVLPDALRVTGFGREPSRLLTLGDER